MTALRSTSLVWRSVYVTLAVLALALKVAIPAGYMIDSRADQPFALVLCTAQGAVAIEGAHAGHHEGPQAPAKAGHDAPCAFAGHGAAFVAAEPAVASTVTLAAYAPAPLPLFAQTVPGRGLSAPPPPARGPPHVV